MAVPLRRTRSWGGRVQGSSSQVLADSDWRVRNFGNQRTPLTPSSCSAVPSDLPASPIRTGGRSATPSPQATYLADSSMPSSRSPTPDLEGCFWLTDTRITVRDRQLLSRGLRQTGKRTRRAASPVRPANPGHAPPTVRVYRGENLVAGRAGLCLVRPRPTKQERPEPPPPTRDRKAVVRERFRQLASSALPFRRLQAAAAAKRLAAKRGPPVTLKDTDLEACREDFAAMKKRVVISQVDELAAVVLASCRASDKFTAEEVKDAVVRLDYLGGRTNPRRPYTESDHIALMGELKRMCALRDCPPGTDPAERTMQTAFQGLSDAHGVLRKEVVDAVTERFEMSSVRPDALQTDAGAAKAAVDYQAFRTVLTNACDAEVVFSRYRAMNHAKDTPCVALSAICRKSALLGSPHADVVVAVAGALCGADATLSLDQFVAAVYDPLEMANANPAAAAALRRDAALLPTLADYAEESLGALSDAPVLSAAHVVRMVMYIVAGLSVHGGKFVPKVDVTLVKEFTPQHAALQKVAVVKALEALHARKGLRGGLFSDVANLVLGYTTLSGDGYASFLYTAMGELVAEFAQAAKINDSGAVPALSASVNSHEQTGDVHFWQHALADHRLAGAEEWFNTSFASSNATACPSSVPRSPTRSIASRRVLSRVSSAPAYLCDGESHRSRSTEDLSDRTHAPPAAKVKPPAKHDAGKHRAPTLKAKSSGVWGSRRGRRSAPSKGRASTARPSGVAEAPRPVQTRLQPAPPAGAGALDVRRVRRYASRTGRQTARAFFNECAVLVPKVVDKLRGDF
eukprot:TRINITY_DN12848_c0_g2_i1.p1 TRINITY_DN12848_c0_g2~~TRINITY_DN12848_c0_g2_i1.p1  ORF type:complete len:816 (+),score=146.14 TRINITY_DN12848_c0_g2_i1:49-2448(+)